MNGGAKVVKKSGECEREGASCAAGLGLGLVHIDA